MKQLIFGCWLLMISESLFAQGFFPLQNGNLWKFACNDSMSPGSETRINGDTTLFTGVQYAIYQSEFLAIRFMRQEGAIVYAHNPSDSSEFRLFNFSLAPDDTVGSRDYYGHHLVTRLIESGQIPPAWSTWSDLLGKKYWTFSDWMQIDSIHGYELTQWIVVDSLGIIEMRSEPGVEWTLVGALIDGVVTFGVINSAPLPAAKIPLEHALCQNYPNPFNPNTTIKFYLSSSSEVSLEIFDMLGRQIAALVHEELGPGEHSVTWSASGYPSGIYFYHLSTDNYSATKRLVLLK